MTDKELLALIKFEHERISPKGHHDFFDKRDRKIPCYPKLKERFNKTFNEILLLAGVDESEIHFIRGKSRGKEYYLEGLKEVAEKLGKTPTIVEYKEHGYSLEMLRKYYKTYANALEEIGLKPNYNYLAKHLTKEEAIDIYIEISNKLGYPATFLELQEFNSSFYAAVLLRHFTSINKLREEAGLKQYRHRDFVYSKKEIKNMLMNLYIKNGRRVAVRELAIDKTILSYDTILRHFKVTSMMMFGKKLKKRLI